jgi:uncharacterized protein YebE (UPF0316 family)
VTWQILLTAFLVFCARLGDVSLGTMRLILVVSGRRGLAWLCAFCEVAVWVVAILAVLSNLSEPIVAVGYCLGYATGTFLGMTFERHIKLGEQVVRIFTSRGDDVAHGLRLAGYRVTSFKGQGRDGPVDLLFIQAPRRKAEEAVQAARNIDTQCFYVIDDVRTAAVARASAGTPLHPVRK